MHIVSANLAKRSGAAILDFIMAFLLWIGLFLIVLPPIYNQAYGTGQIYEDLKPIYLQSNLYIQDGSGTVKQVEDADILATLIAYYRDFKDGETYIEQETAFSFSFSWFNETILNITNDPEKVTYYQYDVDEFNNPNPNVLAILKDNVSEEAVNKFLKDAYVNAQRDFEKYPPYFELASQLEKYQLQMFIISATVSLAIFYLLIPLLLKNGQTLAKRIFGLGVVTSKGYRLQWWQNIVRLLIFAVELVAAIFTVGSALLISYTLMIFTKGNHTVHDFVAKTKVIDLKLSLVFVNAEEEAAYDEQKKESHKKLFNDEIVS